MSKIAVPDTLEHGPLYAFVGSDGKLKLGAFYRGCDLPALQTKRPIARRHAVDLKARVVPVKIVYDAEAAGILDRALTLWRGRVEKVEARLRSAGGWTLEKLGRADDVERRDWRRPDGVFCLMSFESNAIEFWRSQPDSAIRKHLGAAPLGTPEAGRLLGRMTKIRGDIR